MMDKSLDRSDWVKRESSLNRTPRGGFSPHYEGYYYGEKVAEGTGVEICKKLNLLYSKFHLYSSEYDVFDITLPGYYENHDKRELIRIKYCGMKNYSKNYKLRTDKESRRNSATKTHLYGLYDEDELLYMGTLAELAAFIGCTLNGGLQKKAARYDEWDVRYKHHMCHVVYLGVEYATEITCTNCGKTLPISHFQKTKKGIYETVCRKCSNAYKLKRKKGL